MFTSWTEPDEAFETALKGFIRKCLASDRFLASFVPFADTVHRFARLACVSHTVLHIALPGVPDVYQGTELWDLSLVDPDNRRPPNWEDRQAKLQRKEQGDVALTGVESDKDGATKMRTLVTMLALRKRLREVFERGSYAPATVTGPASERVVAFERKHGDKELLVAVGAWPLACFVSLLTALTGRFFAAHNGASWSDTTLRVQPSSAWTEQLTGAKFTANASGAIALGDLFAAGPWAVLERTN